MWQRFLASLLAFIAIWTGLPGAAAAARLEPGDFLYFGAFRLPDEGARPGIDLVECPDNLAPDCTLGTAHSRAYYLDERFERIEEVVIQDFNQGSSDD